MHDVCDWPRCRRAAAMEYLGKELCARHWQALCDDIERRGRAAARRRIGIREGGIHELPFTLSLEARSGFGEEP